MHTECEHTFKSLNTELKNSPMTALSGAFSKAQSRMTHDQRYHWRDTLMNSASELDRELVFSK